MAGHGDPDDPRLTDRVGLWLVQQRAQHAGLLRTLTGRDPAGERAALRAYLGAARAAGEPGLAAALAGWCPVAQVGAAGLAARLARVDTGYLATLLRGYASSAGSS